MSKLLERETGAQHGVLVGWTSEDLGDKIALNIQTFANAQSRASDEMDRNTVFMTKSQAAVLANYLYKVAGTQPPPPRKNWLTSLIG